MIFKIGINKINIILLGFLLTSHLFLLINTKFTLWPEMVVYPYLINNGFLLYKDIINPYPPFLSYGLALFTKAFGYNPINFQVLTWCLILFIDLLIYLIAAKITQKTHFANLSLAFFVVFSIPFGVNGLWFDLFQTPLILIAFFNYLIFLKNHNKYNFQLAFLFLVLAFFIKQQAIWVFLVFILASLFTTKEKPAKILNYSILPLLIFCLIFLTHFLISANQNILKDFVFFNFQFPLLASSLPGYILLPNLRQTLVVLLLFLFFIPIVLVKNLNLSLVFLTALFLLSFAYPRFDFFHLIPLLALLSITIGPLSIFVHAKQFHFKIMIFLPLILLTAFSIRYYFNNLGREIRFFEKEVFEASRQIAQIVPENDSIYIQNGPDQFLPLAKRLPPKPWADEFPWYLEIERQQEKIIEGLKNERPKFVVFKPYDQGGKYTLGAYRPQKIDAYLNANYQYEIQLSGGLWLKTLK